FSSMSIERLKGLFLRARNGWAYLAQGDLRGFMRRFLSIIQERLAGGTLGINPDGILPGTMLKWCVVATPHTLFIAHLMARRLREHGWSVTVTTQATAY